MRWYVAPRSLVHSAIRGTVFVKDSDSGVVPTRLPDWARAQAADDGIRRAADQTAGIHLVLDTSAEHIRLTVALTRYLSAAMPDSERPATFSAVVDGDEVDRATVTDGSVIRTSPDGSSTLTPGNPTTIRLRLPATPTPRRVEIWLPHNAGVEIRRLATSLPAIAGAAGSSPNWVHYGSSISHCIEADGPLGVWPVVAARRLGWQLTDLGLAGQAMLDPFVARTIGELPADLVTLKVGINPINGDALRARTFVPFVHGFLDTIRQAQPTTPIVLISPISCPIHETTPGPTVPDPRGGLMGTATAAPRPGALTLVIVRNLLAELVTRRADPLLGHLDGRALLGPADTDHLHDSLHPDAAGYRLMGTRFADLAIAGGLTAGSGAGSISLPVDPVSLC